ncbi:hypothetical protein RRSWK_02662 [Rhodopirellula sp. SWK7]|nr:hypothetical protein RRSWK_02662 [Rhodopirellula sp. SWK7]
MHDEADANRNEESAAWIRNLGGGRRGPGGGGSVRDASHDIPAS